MFVSAARRKKLLKIWKYFFFGKINYFFTLVDLSTFFSGEYRRQPFPFNRSIGRILKRLADENKGILLLWYCIHLLSYNTKSSWFMHTCMTYIIIEVLVVRFYWSHFLTCQSVIYIHVNTYTNTHKIP